MGDQSEWNARLRSEAASWVDEGLIDESQREKIVAKYPLDQAGPPPLPASTSPSKRRSARMMLPAVLIGLAVLLIGVGLILFYAANWKKMSPPAKLIQVFSMIALSYGGAFFLLFGKRRWLVAGRGLFFLGMLSFGAAIGLVVQTYHISAHPARCVLLWAGFVAAMAAVMRDRIGLYLALVLVLVWDIWERTVYHSPNYPLILAVAALFLLATWVKCTASRFLCVLLAIFWFYAVNFHYLVNDHSDERLALFAFMQIPFGVLLISGAILLRDKVEAGMALMVRLIGWVAVYVSLIALSWPFDFESSLIPGTEANRPFLVEYGVLAMVAYGLVTLVARRRVETWKYLAIGLGVGLVLVFIPVTDPGIFMTVLLLALLLFHVFTLLAEEKIGLTEASIMAFALAVVSVMVHSVGHFVFAARDEELLVVAGLSGLLFVIVMFYLGLLIADQKEESRVLPNVLSLFCVGVITLVLYIVSFIPEEQEGIFDSKPDWMIPTVVLAILAGGLGIFTVLKTDVNRKLTYGATIITVLTITLVLLPGESIHPSLRQLVLNAMMFLIFGLLIAYAMEINSTLLVNLAVGAIVVLVMTRYFDVFWNMLHGSVFFIVTGVVLFAVAGFIEWQRRRLLKRMRTPGKEEASP